MEEEEKLTTNASPPDSSNRASNKQQYDSSSSRNNSSRYSQQRSFEEKSTWVRRQKISFFIDVRGMICKKRKKKKRTPLKEILTEIIYKQYINIFMVNSHACISTYLQIDQETISRRDDSSSRHVSINNFFFCVKREKL
jgi:hypothetical protein